MPEIVGTFLRTELRNEGADGPVKAWDGPRGHFTQDDCKPTRVSKCMSNLSNGTRADAKSSDRAIAPNDTIFTRHQNV